jgi:hypothetical protein
MISPKTREDMHNKLDEILDEMGFERMVTLKWGEFSFIVKYQDGRVTIEGERFKTRK